MAKMSTKQMAMLPDDDDDLQWKEGGTSYRNYVSRWRKAADRRFGYVDLQRLKQERKLLASALAKMDSLIMFAEATKTVEFPVDGMTKLERGLGLLLDYIRNCNIGVFRASARR